MDNLVNPEWASLSLWSPEAISDLRTSAGAAHYPRNKILPHLADALEQVRIEHIARSQGNTETAAKASLALSQARGQIEEELDRTAECGMSLWSLARDRRTQELLELQEGMFAISPTIAGIEKRLKNIERVLAARADS